MVNTCFRKGLVFVIMVLFIVNGIIPLVGSLSIKKQVSTRGSWSSTEVVSTESTDNSYVSSLWVDDIGTIHVAWHDHTNYGGSSGTSNIFYKYKPAGGSWSTTEVVSTESTSSSEQPSLMIDNEGTIHIAWMDDSNYGGDNDFLYDIFYKYKTSGGSWSITEIVSTESTSYAWYPSLWVDSGNTVHVAWEDWTNYGGSSGLEHICYKYKPDGGSWTTTEVISTESTTISEQPSLMIDYDDTVHVAWDDGTDYAGSGSDYDIFYKYKPSSGSWSTTEVVSSESTDHSGRPSLKVDGDGTIYVAWEDLTSYSGSDSDRDIFYNYKPVGGSWSTTEVVSTESTSSSWSPSLWVDDDSTVHVAWDDGTNYGGSGSDDDIFYKYKPSGEYWSTTEVVSTESTDNSWWPSLMIDLETIVHVTWQDWTDYDGSGTDRDIFYKYKESGLSANANGPYYGKPGLPVLFTGSATGGNPPYSWLWDFGDGNTSDEQSPTHVYTTPDNYTVILTVTDDNSDSSDDTTWAYIENNPPNAPTITGEINGKVGVEYTYNFSLYDPDDDPVYLRVDWGSGTPDPWQGPYSSDTIIELDHTWNEQGTFTIRAQTKDIYGDESGWGTLSVTMPKNVMISSGSFLLRLLEYLLHSFCFFPLSF